MLLDRIFRLVQVAALAAVTFAAVRTGMLAERLEVESADRQKVVAAVPALLRSELDATRWVLRDEAKRTRAAALLTANKFAGVVDTHLTRTEDILDTQAANALDVVDRHLAVLDASMAANLGEATHAVTELTARYERLPDEAAYANRWLWDCKEYSGCLQAQTLALVGSARATMGAVAKAAPDVAEGIRTSSNTFAQGFPQLVEDSNGFVANVRRMTERRWYDRLLGVGVVAGATTARMGVLK